MYKGVLALILLLSSGGAVNDTDASRQDTETFGETSVVIKAADETNGKEGTDVEIKALSKDTVKYYGSWKKKYLRRDSYADGEPQYYVYYASEDTGGEAPAVTVSEAHGYGMLITVSMAEYDSNARSQFDALYRYYRAHPSSIGPHLMSWQQGDNGKALVDTNDGKPTSSPDSATDGDMDIAYSLLMADKVWGSDGDINYKEAAVDIINDIMKYEVSHTDWILRLGDWTYGIEKSSKYYAATRSSDFIMQYMPAFYRATGDERWLKVCKRTYGIINDITEEYGTGILPDFIVKDGDKFVPAPAGLLEGENDGNYYYNACRTPWRIGMDGIINDAPVAVKYSEALNSFIKEKTGGDPWDIMAGYDLNGNAVSDWNDLCFDSPFMITAACAGDKEWHDKIRSMVLGYDEDVYYGETITMLCLIVDDGGWITV